MLVALIAKIQTQGRGRAGRCSVNESRTLKTEISDRPEEKNQRTFPAYSTRADTKRSLRQPPRHHAVYFSTSTIESRLLALPGRDTQSPARAGLFPRCPCPWVESWSSTSEPPCTFGDPTPSSFLVGRKEETRTGKQEAEG